MVKYLRTPEELGVEILKNCRREWYRHFPYLDSAFAGLSFRSAKETEEIAVDGDFILFSPVFLIRRYAESPTSVQRGCLHMLLHCLHLHLLDVHFRKKDLWDIACDIAVERMIDEWGCEETLGDTEHNQIKKAYYRVLEQKLPDGEKTFSASRIYSLLEDGLFADSIDRVSQAFHFDDHSGWGKPGGKNAAVLSRGEGLKSKWEKIRSLQGGSFGEIPGSRGSESGSAVEEAVFIEKKPYDYRRFLKKFAVLREEMVLDTESFDYGYYNFGMEWYGNLPLIEPLEYKEGHKLEELVIAIDTSGSCSNELVGRFLEESYGILGEKENFFQKLKVYFIQCDCFIQDTAVIRSKEEWMEYRSCVKIHGRAGTDFRPVFRYVQELQEKKELKNLRALIYFTDGDGIYPSEAPAFETAFVFAGETKHMGKVPGWARKLVLDGC